MPVRVPSRVSSLPRGTTAVYAVPCLILTSAVALGADPTKAAVVGEPAPPLTLERLLQAPAGAKADWSALRGHVVVLEFWATWCVPCVRAVPHLNDLAEQFKDQPVQFL